MKPIAHDRPIRWGILGAGGIAATVCADLLTVPGSEVVAVAARDGDRAQAFAERFGIGRAYGSYAELAADPDIDVVYIATTHGQHHEHALLCIGAGKSVLVEKAFTLTAAQAREVVSAAESADVFCMEAMWLRFNALLGIAAHAIANDAIGDVHSVRAELCRNFPYDPEHRLYNLALGGGALLDLGVYPINLAWMVLGRPSTVAVNGTLSPTGSDATVALQFGYDGGAYAQLACSTAARSEPVTLIVGSHGWLELHGAVHRPTRLVIRHDPEHRELDVEHLAQDAGSGYQPELVEVQRCLREGRRQSEIMPLAQTVEVMELLDAARHELGAFYPGEVRP